MTFREDLRRIIKSIYREIILNNKIQIEFRAKLLTLMIIFNKEFSKCEKIILKNVTTQIYKNPKRAQMLKEMVEEYIELRLNNDIDLDSLLFDIDKTIKLYPKLVFKIDIEKLKLFLKCSSDKDEIDIKTKLISYLEKEIVDTSAKFGI